MARGLRAAVCQCIQRRWGKRMRTQGSAVVVLSATIALGLCTPRAETAWAQAPGLLAGAPSGTPGTGGPVGVAADKAAGPGPSLLDANPSVILMHLTAAIERNPRNARAYNERGKLYVRLDKLQEAIADYTKALEIEPNFNQALGNRGLAYREGGHDQLAIDALSLRLPARREVGPDHHD